MGSAAAKEKPVEPACHKSSVDRLISRLQMCPTGPDKTSSKKNKKQEQSRPEPPQRTYLDKNKIQVITNSSPKKGSEWTEVSLRVPESPIQAKETIDGKNTPIPPPRKHKMRIQQILEIPKKVVNLKKNFVTQENKVPVEEPLIIPKKEPEHICDGTHHHVTNIVNGKKIEGIIYVKPKEADLSLTSEITSKNKSSISLLSYEELKKKQEKNKKSANKNKKKSSLSSLPSERKTKLSSATAERLETYMNRCKSFGSLLPQQLMEKLKNHELQSDNESEDSWGGLDDWDLGIIEHDVATEPKITPSVPRLRVDSHRKKDLTLEKITNKRNSAPILKHNQSKEFPNTGVEMDGTQNKITLISPQIDQDNKPIERIRERKDDSNFPAESKHIPSKQLEGSEILRNSQEGWKGFHGKQRNPFKSHTPDPIFNSEKILVTEFLRHECQINATEHDSSQVIVVPYTEISNDVEIDTPHEEEKINEDVKYSEPIRENKKLNVEEITNSINTTGCEDLLATLQGFCKANENKCHSGEIIPDKLTSTDDPSPLKEIAIEEAPQVTPRRKSGIVEHSNLLKIIKENSVINTPHNDNKGTEKELNYISQPLNSSLEAVEERIKKLENDLPDIEEPKIKPEFKNLEATWQELVKRDDDKLSSVTPTLTEFESALSDVLESSPSISEDEIKSRVSYTNIIFKK